MNLSTLNPNELVGPSGRNVQSAYFDGTGDYLGLPSTSALAFGTGDFCIEAWVYFNAAPAADLIISNITNSDTQLAFRIDGSNFPKLQGWFTNYLVSNTAVTIGQWHHLAVCRVSSTASLYLNGIRTATGTVTNNFSSTDAMTVGGQAVSGTENLNGYMSDLRAIKGSSPYDPTQTTLTVPTAPLTPIANTSFLLGFSEYRFIDQSPNNFTITRNGDTTQSTFGPYGGNWSNYFDGTGDDLSLTGQNLSATDWTVECWVYFQSFSNNAPHVWNFGADGNNRYNVWRNSATGKFSFARVNGGSFDIKNGTTSPVVGQWYHVAVVRVNSTGVQTLYVDGVAEVTNTGAISSGTTWTLGFVPGGAAADRMLGYISNFRVVTSALYTSNFTPPTAPLSSIPNTSLLTCQSNRFLDASPNNRTITRNGDVSVQPYVPFPANWSNYFDGNGDYLSVASSSALDLTSGNFTIELWVYPRSYSASNRTILSKDGRFGVSYSQYSLAFSSTGILTGTVGTGNSTGYIQAISSPTALALNAWYHVAFVKNGTTLTLYVNGVSVASATQTGTMTTGSQALIIGWEQGQPLTHYTDGYLSNLRIVKGTALYTAAFTPSTTPLTAIPNTSLLTCQSSSFTDFSSNNFTVTPNGNVSAQFYGPFAGPVPEPVVDVYTTTGVANTWIKRPGAKAVQMIAIGAGGGGGGGMGSASGVQRNGGAGGGGGANGQIIYTADQLPSTLYIRVGASGTGGASNTSGGAGGNSTIAAADPITTSTSVYCMGGGGGGGEAGAASSSSVGGGGGGTAGAGTTGTGDNAVSGGVPALGAGFALGGGGAGGGNGAAGTTSYAAEWGGGGGGGVRNDGANRQPGGGSLYGGGGGGVGGFVNSAGGAADGICGGASGRYTFGTDQSNFGGGAAGAGSAGGAGANASTLYAAGSGGGGGGVSGFAGGAGGFPGGGGGGGGASTTTGGTGGVGGAGRVVLITFF